MDKKKVPLRGKVSEISTDKLFPSAIADVRTYPELTFRLHNIL